MNSAPAPLPLPAPLDWLVADTPVDVGDTLLVAADREARTRPLAARSEALTARILALGQVKSALQSISSSLTSRVTGGALGVQPANSDSAIGVERRGSGPPLAFNTAISVTASLLASGWWRHPCRTRRRWWGRGC